MTILCTITLGYSLAFIMSSLITILTDCPGWCCHSCSALCFNIFLLSYGNIPMVLQSNDLWYLYLNKSLFRWGSLDREGSVEGKTHLLIHMTFRQMYKVWANVSSWNTCKGLLSITNTVYTNTMQSTMVGTNLERIIIHKSIISQKSIQWL